MLVFEGVSAKQSKWEVEDEFRTNGIGVVWFQNPHCLWWRESKPPFILLYWAYTPQKGIQPPKTNNHGHPKRRLKAWNLHNINFMSFGSFRGSLIASGWKNIPGVLLGLWVGCYVLHLDTFTLYPSLPPMDVVYCIVFAKSPSLPTHRRARW